MSADVVDLQAKRRGDAEDVVRASIRALIAGNGMGVDELAAAAGLARSTLHRRLSGRGTKDAFYAGEIAVIADVLGVDVQELYSGLGGRFGAPKGSVTNRKPLFPGNVEISVNADKPTPRQPAA